MALGPIMTQLLKRYGLESLADWAAEQIINNVSEDEFAVALEERPEYRQRFWMIYEREKKGLAPVSPEEVLAYEAQVAQMGKAFGVQVDRRSAGEMLAADVSAAEAEERLGMAAEAVYQSPPELRSELSRLYGVTAGDLVDYWLRPDEKLPELVRRFNSSRIAAEAQRVGFDTDLTADQAEGLYSAGVTAEGAREGFGRLVESEELFEAVDSTEQDIGVDDQLALLSGDAEVAGRVERRAERRVARFGEGGGFASGRTGLSGLGSTDR